MLTIYSFYRFVPLPDYEALRQAWLPECNARNLKGTILLAAEGLNASLSGERAMLDDFLAFIAKDPRFAQMEYKDNAADTHPFGKMQIRLKAEIIKMGLALTPDMTVGDYLDSAAWDALLADPETVLVDTRNDYEVRIGTFKGALDPKIASFSQFPEWAEKNLDPKKHKKVAMFCTGGIRCEKSTALLKSQGFEEVYHLKGGILQYLAETGNQTGNWQGECYVFDDRVAVGDDLVPTGRTICPVTGKPR